MPYTYRDLSKVLDTLAPRHILEQIGIMAINSAIGMVWSALPWRHSIREISPFWLLPRVDYYPFPLALVPQDMESLVEAWYVDLRNPDDPAHTPLKIVRSAHRQPIFTGTPQTISVEYRYGARPGFRIFPSVPDSMGQPWDMITAVYKAKPPRITAEDANDQIPFDDLHFPGIVEVAKYALWTLSGDPRAQTQLPLAIQAIQTMASLEGVELGQPVVVPSDPLVLRW